MYRKYEPFKLTCMYHGASFYLYIRGYEVSFGEGDFTVIEKIVDYINSSDVISFVNVEEEFSHFIELNALEKIFTLLVRYNFIYKVNLEV